MSTTITIYLDDIDEGRMRVAAEETGMDPSHLATSAVQEALLDYVKKRALSAAKARPSGGPYAGVQFPRDAIDAG